MGGGVLGNSYNYIQNKLTDEVQGSFNYHAQLLFDLSPPAMLVEYTYQQMESYVDALKACTKSLGSNTVIAPNLTRSLVAKLAIRCGENKIQGHFNQFFVFAVKGVSNKWRRLTGQGGNYEEDNENHDYCCKSDALAD